MSNNKCELIYTLLAFYLFFSFVDQAVTSEHIENSRREEKRKRLNLGKTDKKEKRERRRGIGLSLF
jgi:hypothetical protein